ncbi:MAG: MFS transporter, partial [Sutterella wadsworthensis]
MSIQEQNTTRLSNQNTLHNSPKKAPDSTPQHDAKMRRRLFAARAGFFTGGFTVASWAPIIPFVQTELSLEPAVLGTLLFGLGIGSFFGMPIAGTVSTRFGNRAALAASGVLSCLLLVVLAMIPGFRIECAALLLYGVTLGCLEVSANIYGAQLEKEAGHPLMSGLHAAYSVGEVVSAGAITGLLVLGVPLLWVVGGLMVVLAAVLLWALSGVSPAEGRSAAKSEGMVFAPARGRILMLSLVCMSV